MRTAPPYQAKCKNQTPTSLYFGIYYSFGFSSLLFSYFFGVFSGDSGFLFSRSLPDLLLFLNYFLSVSQFPSAKYPMAQNSSYVTAPDQSKVVLQIRAMCRATSSILQ